MAGQIIELKRVANAGLPNIGFRIDGVTLTTTYQVITMSVRLANGTKLDDRDWVIDDDANGIFHFEFVDGEIPEGTHTAELITVDISAPNKENGIPAGDPFRLLVRPRV